MPPLQAPRTFTGNTPMMNVLRPAIGTYFNNTDDGTVWQFDGREWIGPPGSGPMPLTPTPRFGISGIVGSGGAGSGQGGGSDTTGGVIPPGGFSYPPISSPPSSPGPGQGQTQGGQNPGGGSGGGGGTPGGRCGLLKTPSGIYPPNLGNVSVGGGNVIYLRAGLAFPVVPTPGFAGAWNFPTYNHAGADYYGSCVGNFSRNIVGGNGIITIPTLLGFDGHPHTWVAVLQHIDPITHNPVTVQTLHGAFGDPVAVHIIGADPTTFCYSWVDVSDDGPNCNGNAGGFDGFTWLLT